MEFKTDRCHPLVIELGVHEDSMSPRTLHGLPSWLKSTAILAQAAAILAQADAGEDGEARSGHPPSLAAVSAQGSVHMHLLQTSHVRELLLL